MNLIQGAVGHLRQLFRRASVGGSGDTLASSHGLSFNHRHEVLQTHATRGKRVIIIGDIHGCVDEFNLLLKKLDFNRRKDILVLVGDVIAKGPSSFECVRKARDLGAYVVIGNHDYYVATGSFRAGSEHAELAQQVLAKEDINWLRSLPLTLTIEEHDALVVHAGLDPAKPRPEDNDIDNMLHMRSVTSAGEITSSIPQDGTAWAAIWKGPKLVVFGHDAVRGLQQHDHAIGLDTGCVYGRQLSALVLPSKEIVQVDAVKVHLQPG